MPSDHKEKKKFKILALDGGGIRGLVTANILTEVETQIQKTLGRKIPLNQYFDLIVGTSTGSILAASLVLGKSPAEVCKIYEEKGRDIFQAPPLRKFFSWISGSKYSNKGLIEVLRNELGEIKFRDCSKNSSAELLIFAYDTLYRNTTFFISPCPEENRWFNNMKLWEICVSSSSAPTFFPPYEFKFTDSHDQKTKTFTHVDGGVSANCPALAALAHATKIKKKNIEDIAILSIGTGRTTQPLEYVNLKNWGKLLWAKHIPDVFMGGQIQITTDACDQIIKSVNPDGYLRLQFELNKRFGKDGKLLPHNEQINEYIHQNINEEMDNTSIDNIAKLKNATELFIANKKDKIANFIKNTESIELVRH
ncbi:MAG: patatin-like phospholipase family protein [Nostoc sp.]|uniref:patatin-like phospholipase family protein n=1 Tax=Nostoc sp. TaxID=1180 RepID=UPI002FEF3828